MTVTLADKWIQDLGDVSELARLAIAFVDGGIEWLQWAIVEPGVRYAFPDESAMAAGIQQGLQVSRFALTPRIGLMVSPVKLMSMGLADLKVLALAETGDSGSKVGVHARRVMDAHGLLTQTDFDSGAALLQELKVDTAPVFQFMGFEDRLAIYDLARTSVQGGDQNLPLEQEAAAFAAAQARTPREFADYFRIYIGLAQKLPRADTPAKRASHAEAALHALLPRLFPALDCPQVRGLVAPDEVAEAVSAWLAMGRTVGFPRLSAGACQIVLHTRYKGEVGHYAQEFVSSYVAAAQALLSAQPPRRGRMAQDGATCAFPVDGAEHEAVLQLDPAGVISLASFQRKPPRTPPAKAPAPPVKAKPAPQMETAQ
jgi:hypothetical protein